MQAAYPVNVFCDLIPVVTFGDEYDGVCCGALLKTLVFAELAKQLPEFYGVLSFNNVFSL
jgi:hypothetical protein